MSKMDLRSSRSRSRTPFLGQEQSLETEISEAGNHVEKTVVRTTRKTTVVKTNENASSSTDEVTTREGSTRQSSRKSGSGAKSERSLRSRIFKTSDYSSEDGENEVSSSKTIRQNQSNQLREDAKIVGNGSEMPALDLYRRSGRYWDVYPKTDWTYSQHSKDRVEIAPGVVAMPNMSRKTIHALDESGITQLDSTHSLYSENVSHKNVNTENSFSSRYAANSKENYLKSRSKSNYEEYDVRRRTITRWSSFKETITTVFTTIFTVFFSVFRYTYKVQTGFFSKIHKIASQVMLWDTYLLWKTRPGEKAKKLILLCLLPLLLLGSAWLLSGLGGALYGALINSTISASSIIPTFGVWSSEKEIFKRTERDVAGDQATLGSSTVHDKKTVVEEKIVKVTEKIYVEPPSASDIAGSFTKEQLEAIAMAVKNFLNLESEDRHEFDSDKLVQKIINNPSFVNVINNHQHRAESAAESSAEESKVHKDLLSKQQILIDTLLKELDKMRSDIITNNKVRSEEYARLSLEMKKCCNKRPVINVEGYVSRAVTDLLNNPHFLQNQHGLQAWLHSLFVAKQDIEYRLANLTDRMDVKLAAVVESNSQQLMDKVAAKLVETSKETVELHHVKRDVSSIDETAVKKIVKDTLAIYDADRTGMVDYAMESMGGQVVSVRCTEPYHYGKAVVSVLGIPLWHRTNSPRTVITPTIAPGDCWAFQNFPGFIVVKLSNKIRVDAFSMEHISRLLVPDGKLDSAPKEFEVYGLNEENDRDPVLLGIYKYDDNGDPLQFFLVEKDNHVFDMIEIRIVSNHGNPNYTCLYRFRVHGKLHHEVER